jgi:hypothetical protein
MKQKSNSLLTLRGLVVATTLGGMVLLSSCKEDETAQGSGDPSREVTFSAYAQQGAKTRIGETTSSTIDDFNAFAIWSGDGKPLPNLSPANVGGGQGNWTYNPKQFWPVNGTIDFYAFSPDDATGLTVNYSKTNYQPADLTIDYEVTAPPNILSDPSNQQDLLVAVKPGVSCLLPAPVSLHFQHALSRIQLKARPVVDGSTYLVSRVKFLHLSNKGKLALSTANVPDGDGFEYNDDVLTRTPLVLWENHNSKTTNYEFVWGAAVEINDHLAYTDILAGDSAFMVLPQTTELGDAIPVANLADAVDPSDSNFYIRIDFASKDEPTEVRVKYYAVREPLDPAQNLPLTFEAGRSYTFVVDLSGIDYIKFADVIVSKFNEAFADRELPVIDITADPDPAVAVNYEPAPHKGFAGSNIYWDSVNQRLTFDDVDDTAHEAAQGVYFKWGSLVGISPAGAWDGTTTPIYAPIGLNGKHEAVRIPDVYDIDANPPTTPEEWWSVIAVGSEDDIYVSDLGIDDYSLGGYGSYLNSDPQNIAEFKGDICAYLSGRPGIPEGYWRMPANAEFEPASDYAREGVVENNNFVWLDDSDKDDGTFEITNGYRLKYSGKFTFFPASGLRNDSNGALNDLGTGGYVWSSSPFEVFGLNLSFKATFVSPYSEEHRAFGFPVRCVKK